MPDTQYNLNSIKQDELSNSDEYVYLKNAINLEKDYSLPPRISFSLRGLTRTTT